MQWIRAEGVRLPIAKKVGWVSKVAELVNRNGFPTHLSASLPFLSMAFICHLTPSFPATISRKRRQKAVFFVVGVTYPAKTSDSPRQTPESVIPSRLPHF